MSALPLYHVDAIWLQWMVVHRKIAKDAAGFIRAEQSGFLSRPTCALFGVITLWGMLIRINLGLLNTHKKLPRMLPDSSVQSSQKITIKIDLNLDLISLM